MKVKLIFDFVFHTLQLTIRCPLAVRIVRTDGQLACVGVESSHVLRNWRGPWGRQTKLVVSRHTEMLRAVIFAAEGHEYLFTCTELLLNLLPA